MTYYKYSIFKYGLEAIMKKSIKITPPAQLNDPYEAMFLFESVTFDRVKEAILSGDMQTQETEYYKMWLNQEYFNNKDAYKKNSFDTLVLQQQKKITDSLNYAIESYRNQSIGMFSMTTNSLNNLMWAHYGDSYKGMCIGYDFTGSEYEGRIQPIDYIDRRSQLTLKLLNSENLSEFVNEMLTTKSREWEYEEEQRMIFPLEQDERVGQDPFLIPLKQKIITRPIHCSNIKEIIVTPKSCYDEVMRLAFFLKSEEQYKHIALNGILFSDGDSFELKKINLNEYGISRYFYGDTKIISHELDGEFLKKLETNHATQ